MIHIVLYQPTFSRIRKQKSIYSLHDRVEARNDARDTRLRLEIRRVIAPYFTKQMKYFATRYIFTFTNACAHCRIGTRFSVLEEKTSATEPTDLRCFHLKNNTSPAALTIHTETFITDGFSSIMSISDSTRRIRQYNTSIAYTYPTIDTNGIKWLATISRPKDTTKSRNNRNWSTARCSERIGWSTAYEMDPLIHFHLAVRDIFFVPFACNMAKSPRITWTLPPMKYSSTNRNPFEDEKLESPSVRF